MPHQFGAGCLEMAKLQGRASLAWPIANRPQVDNLPHGIAELSK